jgi:hypothetical protein
VAWGEKVDRDMDNNHNKGVRMDVFSVPVGYSMVNVSWFLNPSSLSFDHLHWSGVFRSSWGFLIFCTGVHVLYTNASSIFQYPQRHLLFIV